MLFVNLCFVATMVLLIVNLAEAGNDVTQKVKIRCRDNERRVLLKFKADMSTMFASEHEVLSSWRNNNNDEECCDWRGIRCSNLTGHVTLLNLPSEGLSGEVSPYLSELKHLKYLNLNRNSLTGEILYQLGNLTNLLSLDLSHNLFYGEIPRQLGYLTKLRFLDLSDNEFSGEIAPQLGSLTNMRFLDLGFNRYYGMTSENLDWVSHLHLLTHLDLTYVNLSSCTSWLNQINMLSSLTELHLRACHLPDQYHSLSALSSLAVVDLAHNHFISPQSYNWIFNSTNSLVYVDVSYNSFQRGEIPTAFGRMMSLKSLFLSSCELEGMVPDSLSHLATLNISRNNLTGPLSEFFHRSASNEKSSLKVLDTSYNKLSGSFPHNFGQLSSSLVHLDLSYNQMAGLFPNLTLFSSLQKLTLSHNKLEDTISEAYFSNLSELTHLDLSSNSLTFDFSFDWLPPFKLDKILLRNCSMGPNFPNWIRSQSNFSELDISSARISDKIPLWFWNLSSELISLNLSNNQIESILPDLSVNFPNIESIDLSNNRLQGSLPPFPVDVTSLYLANNMFTGSLSFFCKGGFMPGCTSFPYFASMCAKYKQLNHLDLSNNNLSGELPAYLFENINQIRILNLANNDFSGNIPTSIDTLFWLVSVQLRNNSFTGKLPSWLMNSWNLRLLDLSKNKLYGKLPTWIGTNLRKLIVLSLRENEFSGSIPPQICYLRDAQVLDLSENKLTGSIPHCINHFTSLVKTETNEEFEAQETYRFTTTFSITEYVNAVVQWKGVASEYKRALILLKLVDLSSNRLIGQIPEEFASLAGLISLNLSRNNLTGYVIPKIGQMKNLESLDLSGNHLSGEIPSSLGNLTLLSVLDLSNNDLKGEIPKSTQLQSFDPSQYAGNKQLCGLPLPKCGVVHPPPAGHNDKGNDKFPRLRVYMSVVLGFVTGFWGFIYPIMLRRTWRQSYYTLLGNITDWVYVKTISNMAKLQRKFYG